MIEMILSVVLTFVGVLHLGLRKNLLAVTQSVTLIFMGLAFGFATSGMGSGAVNEATAIVLLICGSLASSLVFALERRGRMNSIDGGKSSG